MIKKCQNKGRKYKTRHRYYHRKTSVISSGQETGPVQNEAQSFQRYTPTFGRGVMNGDYETIVTLDDSSPLSGNIYIYFNLVLIIVNIMRKMRKKYVL